MLPGVTRTRRRYDEPVHAIADPFVALAGLAVALAIVVLVVMAFRTRGGGSRDHTASPPHETQQDFRKPHQ